MYENQWYMYRAGTTTRPDSIFRTRHGFDPARNPTNLSVCSPKIKINCIFPAYRWRNEKEQNFFFCIHSWLNWSVLEQHCLNITVWLKICVILSICDGKTWSRPGPDSSFILKNPTRSRCSRLISIHVAAFQWLATCVREDGSILCWSIFSVYGECRWFII